MDQLWLILIVLIGLIILQILKTILQDSLINPYLESREQAKEGFEGSKDPEGSKEETKASDETKARDETQGMVKWLDNKDLYDTFYAGIYNQLTQGSTRTQAEVGLMLHEWTKRGEDLKTFEVLDVGCGTGIAVATMAKMWVKQATGLDSSK